MQCIHMVKVEPIYNEEECYVTTEPHVAWLKKNNIKRWRGGNFSRNKSTEKYIAFRFADMEDAMAFKLRWA